MANIRSIKKEINFLTLEIISDCNTYMDLHNENSDKAVELVEEAVELRNSLIEKINQPLEITPKYFKEIKKELINGADAIFEKLRLLIK